ncbi:unnamed protein product [Calypogeia fissa]
MELASTMQSFLLGSAAPSSSLLLHHHQQQQQQRKNFDSIAAVQSALLRRSRCPDHHSINIGTRPSAVVNANYEDSRLVFSGKIHVSLSKTAKRRSSSSQQICQVLSSVLEAHALTQATSDPLRVYEDRTSSEPEPLRNEEADGVFKVPIEDLRALLRLWDIDNDETDYYELLTVADYLERLGLDAYFRQEVKAILDRIFRIWTENSLSKTAAMLGDLPVVGLAFHLLRSHEYDVQPDVFELYKKEDGSFCKTPQLVDGETAPSAADLTDLLNLLRASDLKFRRDGVLHEAHNFASSALTSLLDGAQQPPLSEKASAEVKYRLSYPWAINFRILEMRQTLLNFEEESFMARFSNCARLSLRVVSLMISTATQLFNHYNSNFQQEIDEVRRWSQESGCEEVNVRPSMVLRPFHLGLAYEMPQARYAYTRDAWAKVWYILIIQDDLYDDVNLAYTVDEMLIFMDAFRKFDPSILEKIPNIEEERYKAMRVVYKAMYDLTVSLAAKSSLWYGRDMLRTFIDTWMVRLEIYLNEKRWVEENYKLTIEEYIEEYGKWSFLAETGCPLGYYSIPGQTLSPSFFETRPDMKALFALARTGRYLNDARSYEHEKAEGKVQFIDLLMEENRGLTEEDAVKRTEKCAQSALEEFTEAILCSRIPHPEVKQMLLCTFRTTTLLYYHVDGLRVQENWDLGKLCDPVPTLTP